MKIKNTTANDILLVEFSEKQTTLAPGDEMEIDPTTTMVEIRVLQA